jgi:hypothetical protein
MLEIAVGVHGFVKRLAGRFSHHVFKPGYLGLDLVQLLKNRDCLVANAVVPGECRLLFEQANAEAPQQHDFTAIRLFTPGDESKDGSLARAVATYQANAFAWVDLKRRATQDSLGTIGFVNVV